MWGKYIKHTVRLKSTSSKPLLKYQQCFIAYTVILVKAKLDNEINYFSKYNTTKLTIQLILIWLKKSFHYKITPQDERINEINEIFVPIINIGENFFSIRWDISSWEFKDDIKYLN